MGLQSTGAVSDTHLDVYKRQMHNYTVEKSQLPLFALNPAAIATRYDYWLRDVVTAANFAIVGNNGLANRIIASNSFGVRPAFCIC